jgi:drug efflux transport system permease protein
LIAFLPAFLLSGFAFPLDSIPTPLQWLSYAFPGRYMVAITRGVFLKGAGFPELWPQLAALTAYAVLVLLASSLLYRRRSR